MVGAMGRLGRDSTVKVSGSLEKVTPAKAFRKSSRSSARNSSLRMDCMIEMEEQGFGRGELSGSSHG